MHEARGELLLRPLLADQLFHDKNALKLALKFFKSAEIALTPRDVSKNTIWSRGFPSYSRVMTLESQQLAGRRGDLAIVPT